MSNFCTNCGSKIAEMTLPQTMQNQPLASLENAPRKNKRTTMLVAIISAVVILIAVAIAFIVFAQSSGDQDVKNQEVSEAVDKGKATKKDNVPEGYAVAYETDLFQILLPKDLVNEVVFTTKNNSVTMQTKATRMALCEIFPQGEALAGEHAHESWDLGEVYIAGHFEEAIMSVPLVDSSGSLVHGSKAESLDLQPATTKSLDITPKQMAELILLSTGSMYKASTPSLISNVSQSSDSASSGKPSGSDYSTTGAVSPGKPFWGVWCGAFKDKTNADKYAWEIIHNTEIGAIVLVSTDWENLNSDRYYVVTAGTYSTEAAAEKALKQVKSAGYSNAYVKYSGSPRG